jgi:hypothetical protein
MLTLVSDQAGLAFAAKQEHREMGLAVSAICSADWAARLDQRAG